MRKILPLLAITLLLVAVVVPITIPSHKLSISVAASPSSGTGGTDNFTIYVNILGLNDTSAKLTLPVNQGDTVIINFVWNDSGVGFDNAHQMEVQGYAIKSAVIGQNLLVSSIKFTADKTGTFQINCIIPCEGMDEMQNGWLVVKAAQGTTVTSGTSTTTSSTQESTLATQQSLSLSLHNGGLLASVHLIDSTGKPVADASVQFSVMTDFGLMSLGSNTTNSNGIVDFSTSTLPAGWTGVYTSFEGSGNLNASSTHVALNAAALDPSQTDPSTPYVSGQGGFLDLRLVGVPPLSGSAVVNTFLFVLICVYLVLAIVVIRVTGIRRRE